MILIKLWQESNSLPRAVTVVW